MTERKFIDCYYNPAGEFIMSCELCQVIDKSGQGNFWGCFYLCPDCDKKMCEKHDMTK